MKTASCRARGASGFLAMQVCVFAVIVALIGGCAPGLQDRGTRRVDAELSALKARVQRVENALARLRASRAVRMKRRSAHQPRPLLPIKKLGPRKYQITAMAKDDFVRIVLGRPGGGGGGFVPAMNPQGAHIGFKLLRVKPGSIFTLLGFQNGDVFLSMNGIRLTDTSMVSTLTAKLAATRLLQIEIQRNTQTLSFTYVVRKFIW